MPSPGGAELTIDEVSFVTPDTPLLRRLLPVARRIFSETFGADYDPVEFERFCDSVYLPGGSMAQDFETRGVRWQLAAIRGEPIGYAKLTPLRAPFPNAARGAVELQQIYVVREWHGRGVANRLMDWGLNAARALGAPEVYLTVFDHNERAKRFYARHGFEDVGRCTFQLGDRIDDDRIWRLTLPASSNGATA
jgi:ribosomal protein S18 acetylase RimI-like enzyme